MKRKEILSLILSMAFVAASLMGCGQQAGEEDGVVQPVDETEAQAAEVESIEQEFEFYTDDEDVIYYNIPETIEQDGKTYQLANEDEITYENMGEREVVQQVVDADVEELSDIPETIEYEGENGKTYTLQNEQVYVAEEGTITIPVTEEVVYEDQAGKPSVSNTKTITYYNKATGQDEEIEGILQDYYESTPGHWSNTLAIDGVFSAPSTNCTTYTLAGTDNIVVEQSAETPAWETYQTDILASLNLSPDYFRINAAAWNGGQYSQDGYVMRNAQFTGDVYVASYTAVYEGTGESLGYKTKTFYRADADTVDADEEDVTNVIKIKAIVRYELVEDS